MVTFFFALAVVLISVAGLATGILLGRAPLRGSCGGLACVRGISCAACKVDGTAEKT